MSVPPHPSPTASPTRRPRRSVLYWLTLLIAIGVDAVATFALAAAHGFRRPLPAVLALAGISAVTYLSGVTVSGLGPRVTYAVLGALGTVTVAVIGMTIGRETANWVKVGALTLIMVGVTLLPMADRG
jgi:multidrug transporter EmrE-like cation transporter